jgi:hypothetical protein
VDAETRECEGEARAIAQARRDFALAKQRVRRRSGAPGRAGLSLP